MKREYNYVYIITNDINDKTYIGIHKTDNINDGYMGSGTLIKRAIAKYGIEHFKKEILFEFDSYEECLAKEKELVDLSFILDDNNYNVALGGFGGQSHPDIIEKIKHSNKIYWNNAPELRKHISECKAMDWKNNREKYLNALQSPEARQKAVASIKRYIKNNPEKHAETMLKINTNPEKIRKTAEAHTGMNCTDIAKQNMSSARKELLSNDNGTLIGKGCKYVTNTTTNELKRVNADYVLQTNEVFGNKKISGIKNKVVTNIKTMQVRKVSVDYQLQENEVFGDKKKKSRTIVKESIVKSEDMNKNYITIFDIETQTTFKVHKDEYNKLKNIRYFNCNSKVYKEWKLANGKI